MSQVRKEQKMTQERKKCRKYICGGFWESTSNGKDFDCEYGDGSITCDECVVNGGNRMPKGMKWKMENL